MDIFRIKFYSDKKYNLFSEVEIRKYIVKCPVWSMAWSRYTNGMTCIFESFRRFLSNVYRQTPLMVSVLKVFKNRDFSCLLQCLWTYLKWHKIVVSVKQRVSQKGHFTLRGFTCILPISISMKSLDQNYVWI